MLEVETMLRIEGGAILLKEVMEARVFRRGCVPVEVQPESNLMDLLSPIIGGEDA